MPFATSHDEFVSMQEHDSHPPPPEMLSALKKLLSDASVPVAAIARLYPVMADPRESCRHFHRSQRQVCRVCCRATEAARWRPRLRNLATVQQSLDRVRLQQ
jgi:hypothetical protein